MKGYVNFILLILIWFLTKDEKEKEDKNN